MTQQNIKRLSVTAGWLLALAVLATPVCGGESIAIWPDSPPGDNEPLGEEHDTTTDTSNLVAGRRVMRITNVSQPTIEVFEPPEANRNGTSVVICPGGGYYILAYDLEGTEVAEWLNRIGVTAFVLKYRVPAREGQPRWKAAVQDAQRAVSMVRHRASEWQVDPDRVGILGFSAGGNAAGLTSLMSERQYAAADDSDGVSCRPNFGILIYAAYFCDRAGRSLLPHVTVDNNSPPLFMVHTFDDPVPIQSSLLVALEMKRAARSAELHAYATGGHGYGLRETDEPCTRWPEACERWMQRNGWIPQPQGASNER